MGEVAARPVLLADADVLIDYVRSDPRVLRLVAEHIGPVKILRQVLDTVDQLSEADCRELALEIVDLPTETLLEAGQGSGALSFEDRLCLLACKANGWTCISNDRVLIRSCDAEGIPFRRGLRLMVDLVAGGHITKQRALRVASAIHAANPYHINEDVLSAFNEALEAV
ncbi:MAG TPA: hypothetical protein VKM54_07665 [Myxococcota bacterium]|nr:hypothetical protein [Myxococcota bacterium]